MLARPGRQEPLASYVARQLAPRASSGPAPIAVLDVTGPAGRTLIGGLVAPLAGAELRAAAVEYAERVADPELLQLGHGVLLYRMDPREIRLIRDGIMTRIDVDEYVAADPCGVPAQFDDAGR
jgi:hypothetical protein